MIDYAEIGISKEKNYMQLVNNPLFSVLGYFHLSQSEISKHLTKIPISANVSKN